MSGKRKPLNRTPKDSSCSSDDDSLNESNAKSSSKECTNSVGGGQEVKVQSVHHDPLYDESVVSSPGGSSTSSGPIYIRPPGFQYHGQELTTFSKTLWSKGGNNNKKKKAFLSADVGNLIKKSSSSSSSSSSVVNSSSSSTKDNGHVPKLKQSILTPSTSLDSISGSVGGQASKLRNRREPLPMKLRALPQSFWQQPNLASSVSPGQIYSTLPPVISKEVQDVTDTRNSELPLKDDSEKYVHLKDSKRLIKVSNTDWLFKLFEGLDEVNRVPVVKRGRPKKLPCSTHAQVLRGEDPCMANMASDALLPLLQVDSRNTTKNHSQQVQPTLTMVSLRDRDKSVSLPALHVERNYSQLLSELVVKL